MKDLNVRQESIKILEENIGNNLYDISHSHFFHDILQRQEKQKKKWNLINKWVKPHQDKKLLHSHGPVKKTKRQPTEWEKIFANDTTDKGVLSKIYKELLKLNTQNTNNQVKNWAEDTNRHFSKEDIWMAKRHMKKMFNILAIREIQIKTTLR